MCSSRHLTLVCGFLLCLLGTSGNRLDPCMCFATKVTFIMEEVQPDWQHFHWQVQFFRGFCWMNSLKNESRVSLFVYNSLASNRSVLRPVFTSVSMDALTDDLWYGRPKSETVRPHDLGKKFISGDSAHLVVALNVELPLQTLLPNTFLQDNGRPEKSGFARIKFYNIFTHIELAKKTQISFVGEKSDMVIQFVTKPYNGIAAFRDSFRNLYDDLCGLVMYADIGLWSIKACSFKSSTDLSEVSGEVAINAPLPFAKEPWKLLFFASAAAMQKKESLSLVSVAEAEKACGKHGMGLMTMRTSAEILFTAHLFEIILNKLFLYQSPELYVTFGLKRNRENVGRRFSWRDNRDLLFSLWADGEPREPMLRECALWKFSRAENSGDLIDAGFESVRCHDKLSEVVVCQTQAVPEESFLHYTKDDNENTTHALTRGAFGKMRALGSKRVAFVVSLSTLLASGFLHAFVAKPSTLDIYGLVHNQQTTFSHNSNDTLLASLEHLYHHCNEGDEQTYASGVPLSLVCDGKWDCKTGTDEAFCGEHGYAPCTPSEFTCASGQCVPLAARCDLLWDCQDGTDEKDCDLECPHRPCSSGRCLPKPWFQDGEGDCRDASDEIVDFSWSTCVFLCNRTQCVTRAMLNDSVLDCQGPEGPLDETLGSLESVNCTNHNQVSFLNNWAPRCVLAHDSFGVVIGCRNAQHLSGCENFTCPSGYIKCPDSFCIPLSYVNDGKQDCGVGEDEAAESLAGMANFFICDPRTDQRVPLSALCDGRADCAGSQDELDCGYLCQPGLICLAGVVSAVTYNGTLPLQDLSFIDPRTRYLDLSGMKLNDFFSVYPRGHLKHLLTLNLSRCAIDAVVNTSHRSRFSGPGDVTHLNFCGRKRKGNDFETVQTMDLSHNQIAELPKCSFITYMRNLKELNFSFNRKLSFLHQDCFTGLNTLRVLDLSFTSITHISKYTLADLHNLTRLNLEGSKLKSITFIMPEQVKYLNLYQTNVDDIGSDIFTRVLGVNELKSSTYKLCCPVVLGPRISRHICQFPGRAITSCTDLVQGLLLKVILWIMSAAILIGNIATLLYRLICDSSILQKPHGLFVTNLGLSDLLMGFYLVMVGSADVSFRGRYVFHEYTWRYSMACWTAGLLSVLSSITSTIFVFLITLDRFVAVRYPFGEVRFTARTMTASVVLTWIFGVAAAALPFMPFASHWVIFSRNGMCLSLPLSSERLPGWQYPATLFVGLNLLLFVFIGTGQYAIFRTLQQKSRRTRKSLDPQSRLHQTQRLQEFAVAKQLSLVVVSNFVCWFPIISLGLLALSGQHIGEAVYEWTAVLVMPVNAALNPVLYTVPALVKTLQHFKAQFRWWKPVSIYKGVDQHDLPQKASFTIGMATPRRLLLLRTCKELARLRTTLKAKANPNTMTSEFHKLFKALSEVQAKL